MKARDVIKEVGATYGPQALKMIGATFDEAWAEISHHFDADGTETEAVRLALANAILEAANEGNRDPAALKNAALQTMALASRD